MEVTAQGNDELLERQLNDLQTCNRIETIREYAPYICSIDFLCIVARNGHVKLFKTILALREDLSKKELIQLFTVAIDANRRREEERGESTGIIKYLLTQRELPLDLIVSVLPSLLNFSQGRRCPATLQAIIASSRFLEISTDKILHIWNFNKETLSTIPHFRTAHGYRLGHHLVLSLELDSYFNREHWMEIPDSYIGRAFRKLFKQLERQGVQLLVHSTRFCAVSGDELGGALLELFKNHARSFQPLEVGQISRHYFQVQLIRELKNSGRWEEIPYTIRAHLYFLCKEHRYLDLAAALGSDAEYSGNENYVEPTCFLGDQLIRWVQGTSKDLTWQAIQSDERFADLCQIEYYAMQAFVSAGQLCSVEKLQILIHSPLFQIIPDASLEWLLDLILSQERSPRGPFVEALIYSGRCRYIPESAFIKARATALDKRWLDVLDLIHERRIEMTVCGEIANESTPCIVS